MRIKKKILEKVIREFLLEQEDEAEQEAKEEALEDLVVLSKLGKEFKLSIDNQGINLFIDDEPYKSDDQEEIREKIAAVVSKAYTSVVDGTANQDQETLIKKWVERTIDGGLERVANLKARLSVVFDAMADATEGKNKLS